MSFIDFPHRQLVLIVEDQEVNQELLGMILADQYELLFARDGGEAIDLIRQYRDLLSIVLLDLLMPGIDGFQVLETMRNDKTLSHIPVIVLTSEKDAELKALRAGAADFIPKPFDMHEVILARVARMIELREGRHMIQSAGRDPLTGLYTAGFFFAYAEQHRRYYADERRDAVVVDIDRFHSINEMNGREFGDRILKVLGSSMRTMLTKISGIACRAEADLFYLFLSHQENCAPLLEELQNAVSSAFENTRIRLRMGVCPHKDGLSPMEQIDRAKAACNTVRGNYLTSLVVYDDAMHEKDLRCQRLSNDVLRAAEDGELMVFYQPKYDITCTPPRLKSAEALIRWNHSEFGMISPGEFIPLFEGNGLVQVIDHFVWRTAAAQIAEWKKRFGFTLPVSVNLSRVDIFDPSLETTLLGIVRDNGLNPQDLILEVTESAYTDDADGLIKTVEQLRRDGFLVEMDDFGSGYSSLNMLSTLPIDALKMDMRFVRNIHLDEREFRLVELIIDIARYLGVPIIAEGVENEAQLTLLKDAGCNMVQGYYFSRPVKPQEFEVFLSRMNVEENK